MGCVNLVCLCIIDGPDAYVLYQVTSLAIMTYVGLIGISLMYMAQHCLSVTNGPNAHKL